MTDTGNLEARIAAALRETIAGMERDAILGYVAGTAPPAPQPDILADMLAAKRRLDALPPVMLAVKCHPASEAFLRRTLAPARGDGFGLFEGPQVFWDVRLPVGKYLPAYDRATVDGWRLASMRRHLVDTLRDRLRALAGHHA